jgi:hypothetical protein
LTDHTTKRRRLSELQGQHSMVLVLSRGGYSPKDRRQAELLVQFLREMEVGYCRLVTIRRIQEFVRFDRRLPVTSG